MGSVTVAGIARPNSRAGSNLNPRPNSIAAWSKTSTPLLDVTRTVVAVPSAETSIVSSTSPSQPLARASGGYAGMEWVSNRLPDRTPAGAGVDARLPSLGRLPAAFKPCSACPGGGAGTGAIG